jgi:hypothetical protein
MKKINNRAALTASAGAVGIQGEDNSLIFITPGLARVLAAQLPEIAALADKLAIPEEEAAREELKFSNLRAAIRLAAGSNLVQ